MCLSGSCRGDRKPHFPLLIFVMPEAHALWVLPLQLEFGGDVSQALLIFTSNSCKNQVSSRGSKLAQICFKVWPRFSEWLTLTKVHPSSWLEHMVGSVVKEQRSPRTRAQGFRTLQTKSSGLFLPLLSCHPILRTPRTSQTLLLNPQSQCGVLQAKHTTKGWDGLLGAGLGGIAVRSLPGPGICAKFYGINLAIGNKWR